ncbi:uncharacterized protein P884DRAFT_80254 [Thermothelomyces heterothallicus CBS 202.75]|uniref:uncharacterized protein n=1 Tax=Thermothelomyces heterothallicus CBS 202.75 TaxID=1149848 RepID=UPI003742D136
MILSAKVSLTVLLAAAAQHVVAAPQRNSNGTARQAPSNEDGNGSGIVRIQTLANPAPAPSAIPSEVLASQQSSAAAVASAVAAANEAAAASGLKELPGLQADESSASLLPLPALATGDAITPPAGADSSTTVTPGPTQVASQSDVAETQSLEGGLRQLPGLGAGAASPSSLAPLPTPPSVDTSAETATSGVAQIIGSFTEVVGETTAEAVSSATAATSAAGAVVGSFTPVTGGTTAAAVIGSFSPITASPSANSGAAQPTAFVTPAQGFVFTNDTSPGRGAAQATGGTSLPLPSDAAGVSLPTLPGLNNSTAATGTGIGAGISNGTIGEDGNNSASSPSLRPLPGLSGTGDDTSSGSTSGGGGSSDGGNSSLQPLPNDPIATATAGPAPEGDLSLSAPSASPDAAAEATAATASALTTLTTVLANGATSTLVTAAAAAQTAGGSREGAGVANVTAGSGAEGRVEVMARGGVWMGVVVGAALGMMAILMA